MSTAPPLSLHTEHKIWVKLFPLLSAASCVSIVPWRINIRLRCSGFIFSFLKKDSKGICKFYSLIVDLLHVNHNKSPAYSPAAIQGHRDLLGFHLVELRLDLVDAGCNGGHTSTHHTFPYGSLGLQSIILSPLGYFKSNSSTVFPVTYDTDLSTLCFDRGFPKNVYFT